MGGNACHKTTYGVGADCFTNKVAVSEGVKHSRMGREKTAPAHTYGSEYCYGIVVNNIKFYKARNKANGRSDSAKCSYGK